MRPLLIAALAGLVLAGCGGPAGDTPVDTAVAPITTEPAPEPVSPPVHLYIPKIGVDVDLTALGLDKDGAMDVPKGAMDAGYFAGADPAFEGDEVLPGEVGPSVVAGHVDWNGALGVFNRLDELRAGSEVFITQADGGELVFVVTEVEQVDKGSFPTERVWGNTDKPELRLITCGGTLDRSTGHYTDNVLAYADLV